MRAELLNRSKAYQEFKNNPDKLPSSYSQEQSEIQNSVDYVAGMTDRFAISTYNSIH